MMVPEQKKTGRMRGAGRGMQKRWPIPRKLKGYVPFSVKRSAGGKRGKWLIGPQGQSRPFKIELTF